MECNSYIPGMRKWESWLLNTMKTTLLTQLKQRLVQHNILWHTLG